MTAAARVKYTTVMKSAARKEAGKVKAASLTSWKQDVKAACEALKQEGYKGSLNLKKGSRLYAKIEVMRKGQAAASGSGASVSASAARDSSRTDGPKK